MVEPAHAIDLRSQVSNLVFITDLSLSVNGSTMSWQKRSNRSGSDRRR
jgi:hypothetical protein